MFSRQTPTWAFLSDGTGKSIFRFDVSRPGGPWTAVTSSFGPYQLHSDMRFMSMDASNQLVMAGDGGVMRLNSPTPETVAVDPLIGLGWVSIVGDMSVSELHAVAYNAMSDTVLVGTQDNSCGQLNPDGSWTGIGIGDGGQVSVWSTATESISYYSSQIYLQPKRVDCSPAACTTTSISANNGVDVCRPMSYWPITVRSVESSCTGWLVLLLWLHCQG